jgi:hypothetical protein
MAKGHRFTGKRQGKARQQPRHPIRSHAPRPRHMYATPCGTHGKSTRGPASPRGPEPDTRGGNVARVPSPPASVQSPDRADRSGVSVSCVRLAAHMTVGHRSVPSLLLRLASASGAGPSRYATDAKRLRRAAGRQVRDSDRSVDLTGQGSASGKAAGSDPDHIFFPPYVTSFP